MKVNTQLIKSFPIEALVWFSGLGLLLIVDPSHDTHFTICPFANLGFEFCPGCGLGRSIAFLFRGEFLRSFQSHPLGLFAVLVLTNRIVKLFRQHFAPGQK